MNCAVTHTQPSQPQDSCATPTSEAARHLRHARVAAVTCLIPDGEYEFSKIWNIRVHQIVTRLDAAAEQVNTDRVPLNTFVGYGICGLAGDIEEQFYSINRVLREKCYSTDWLSRKRVKIEENLSRIENLMEGSKAS